MNLLGKTLPMITGESECTACGQRFDDTEGLGALLFCPHGTDAVCLTCITTIMHWAAQGSGGALTLSHN